MKSPPLFLTICMTIRFMSLSKHQKLISFLYEISNIITIPISL